MDVDVVHRPEQSRFEAQVEGGDDKDVPYLSYELAGETAVLTHTIVPRHLEGRGIAGQLAQAAVGWARGEGLDIDPQCSYVRSWIQRNGEPSADPEPAADPPT
jgi:predicted GNAT family acetyltransferase